MLNLPKSFVLGLAPIFTAGLLNLLANFLSYVQINLNPVTLMISSTLVLSGAYICLKLFNYNFRILPIFSLIYYVKRYWKTVLIATVSLLPVIFYTINIFGDPYNLISYNDFTTHHKDVATFNVYQSVVWYFLHLGPHLQAYMIAFFSGTTLFQAFYVEQLLFPIFYGIGVIVLTNQFLKLYPSIIIGSSFALLTSFNHLLKSEDYQVFPYLASLQFVPIALALIIFITNQPFAKPKIPELIALALALIGFYFFHPTIGFLLVLLSGLIILIRGYFPFQFGFPFFTICLLLYLFASSLLQYAKNPLIYTETTSDIGERFIWFISEGYFHSLRFYGNTFFFITLGIGFIFALFKKQFHLILIFLTGLLFLVLAYWTPSNLAVVNYLYVALTSIFWNLDFRLWLLYPILCLPLIFFGFSQITKFFAKFKRSEIIISTSTAIIVLASAIPSFYTYVVGKSFFQTWTQSIDQSELEFIAKVKPLLAPDSTTFVSALDGGNYLFTLESSRIINSPYGFSPGYSLSGHDFEITNQTIFKTCQTYPDSSNNLYLMSFAYKSNTVDGRRLVDHTMGWGEEILSDGSNYLLQFKCP
jgi:hypothetical protein